MSFSEWLQELSNKMIFPIDLPSQKYTNRVTHKLLFLSSIISVVLGIIYDSMKTLLYFYGASVLICLILVVPAYPSYNENKLKWVERGSNGKSNNLGKSNIEIAG
ncbi:related to Signal peptidase complex subunit SPC1 [Saccharomycodes ludwigii]|uniref:Signal peptidase complex subunit 1 n=1 Tax=Saccharomycodes ludwigii TaxID=36035 RepID=A0A376B9B7_9ASCO|nr:hypothetical protein SCDLUD_004447 [Saccharomycodes ludwigii]KAH3899026.1 hypothetical protein SCDLUD_004447 [Saccharomycodes ludwigii]SSD60720.1 related to Signal peptidase complex subunit SPC1 [Saccharomycodes ludwigii]